MYQQDTTSLTDRIGTAIHGIIPSSELDGIVSNIGLSVSGINMAYNNSGTIGDNDADILVSLKPSHAPTDDYVKTMREQLPRMFPGTTSSFLPVEYQSAMSKKVMPRSSARRRIGTESGSSSTQPFQAELPSDIVPRQSCETRSPVRPNRMYAMRHSAARRSIKDNRSFA